VTYGLFLPTGVNVEARVIVGAVIAGNARTWVYSPLMSDEAAGNSEAVITNQGAPAAARVDVLTNTSAQVRAISDSALTTFTIRTIGWCDRRGKDN
jgi:hypothetical protein